MKGKLNLGVIILVASFLIGISLELSIPAIIKNFLLATIDPTTLRVVGIIILIMILGNLLEEGGILQKINLSLEVFIKNRRLALIVPSVLMGLLPAPAGAMLSAPMVEESGNKMGLSAEIKTFLNYWFRHPWEFVWPIYPHLILASTILNVSVYKLVIAQSPLMLTALFVGYVFGLRKVSNEKNLVKKGHEATKSIYMFFFYAWPIFAIIILVLILRLNLVLSLCIIVAFAFFATKVKRRKIPFILINSLRWRITLLVVSVMIFKKILEVSGMLTIISELFNHLGTSYLFTLFFIPFVIGILTGISLVPVAVSFPLLLPIIGVEHPNLSYAMLAYTGGAAGYLLSPLHLCLVTTVNYFKADFAKVYKMIILPVISVATVAFIIALFG